MKRKIASAKTPWGQSEVNAKVKELKQQNIVEFKIKKIPLSLCQKFRFKD